MKEENTSGLYIHIPFCVRKCRYCDFLSFPTQGKRVAEETAYVEALCREIRHFDPAGRTIETIFFGGGTPSILSVSGMEKIMETVYDVFSVEEDAEISLEANPGTFDEEKVRAWRSFGFNRLSIGLQSTDDEALKRLGRIHTYADFRRGFEAARAAGFDNINIDLMAGLPQQTLENYRENLYDVLKSEPEHISSYGLILEEGTPFFDAYRPGAERASEMPEEDVVNAMYELTKEMLDRSGYARYEISNYARPGYACRHNLRYWKRLPYAGFGLGAASHLILPDRTEIRCTNTSDFAEYLSGKYRAEEEILSGTDILNEVVFLGLRLTEGISYDAVRTRYGRDLGREKATEIRRLVGQGLLHEDERGIRLTERGLEVSNYVMTELFEEA